MKILISAGNFLYYLVCCQWNFPECFPGYLKIFQSVSGVFGWLPIFDSNVKAEFPTEIYWVCKNFLCLQKPSSQLVFRVFGQRLRFLSAGKFVCFVSRASYLRQDMPCTYIRWEPIWKVTQIVKQLEWRGVSFLPFWSSPLFSFLPSWPDAVIAIPAANKILYWHDGSILSNSWHLFQVSNWRLCQSLRFIWTQARPLQVLTEMKGLKNLQPVSCHSEYVLLVFAVIIKRS